MTHEEWEKMDDMSRKTVIVTGANSGLGYEAVRTFASHGAHVVLACRSTNRGEKAVERIHEESPDASTEVLELDLADLWSVKEFASAFTDDHDALHVLCNNAGVMAIPRQETTDGFETQFGVNHLGHFALTGLLMGHLRETEDRTRVVTQSSGLHENGEIDFDDLQSERSYDKWDAYSQSKLAHVLFAYELDRRLNNARNEVKDENEVEDVMSVACHPGYAATNLQLRCPEQSGSTLRLWMMKAANMVLAQDAERGALSMLYAATASDVAGGDYVGPGGFMNMRGSPTTQRSSERSYDEATAERLWTISEEMTGVTYDLGTAKA
jgi:NAD(P)-dependent dehydrogenase (short-subunit alcohol dehydrogenase family)